MDRPFLFGISLKNANLLEQFMVISCFSPIFEFIH